MSFDKLVTCGLPGDREKEDLREVYMGYVISYYLALYEYQWRGGNLAEKLHTWLPSAVYLKNLPPYLDVLSGDESLQLGNMSV